MDSPTKHSSNINHDRSQAQPEPDTSNQNELSINEGNPRKFCFFIFANPKSGSNKGAELNELGVETMIFSYFKPHGCDAELHIYDLWDSKSKDRGMKALKEEIERGQNEVRVACGGGDGTTMWVVDEMQKHKVPIDKIVLGTIPLGTGNHISRTLGWGKVKSDLISGRFLGGLKGLISDWVISNIEPFDLWDVTIECYDEGGVRQVVMTDKNRHETRYLMNIDEKGVERKILTFRRKMSNYFSLGFDAAVGYEFEKHRSKSRIKNGLTYLWKGIKKSFTHNSKITDFITSIESFKDPESESIIQSNKETMLREKGEFIIHPVKAKKLKKEPASTTCRDIYIKDHLHVLLFLNIPHYAGGKDIWDSKRARYGSTNEKGEKYKNFAPQNFHDGILEILGFRGVAALSTGMSNRLWQTSGPVVVNFKRSESTEDPLQTHFEIDGEHFELLAPKRAIVRRCPDLPSINVMVKRLDTKK